MTPPKIKVSFQCTACQKVSPKWAGQCPFCEEWNTLEERQGAVGATVAGLKSKAGASVPTVAARAVTSISTENHKHRPTGIGEFDRVLGGGFVAGGVILLAGEPGVGKSTITNAIAASSARKGIKTLIASGEESAEQITMRLQRIGGLSENLFLAAENDLSRVLGHIDAVDPGLIIVDSVQTIAAAEVEARVGSPSQVIEVGTVLTRIAKERGIPLLFIGHVTKDGNIAGPRTMEHLVDVVLHFEGDRDSTLKMLRGVKNRFGPADEVGCFEHTEEGIVEVPDPSGMLLGQRTEPVPGVMTSVIVEGKRPLPIEIQSLVALSALPVPRRAVSGLDTPRATMAQAVTERYGQVRLSDKDVYLATIGGAKTREPSIDLATVMALASACENIPTHFDAVAIGEVALSGEVRKVPGISRRLNEAYRLGFKKAFVPEGAKESLPASLRESGFIIVEISNVAQAVAAVRAMGPSRG